MGNGIKFTDKGSVVLNIQSDRSSNRIVFSITDTGPGILEQDMPILFAPFSQTKLGKQSGQGTGLGLSISQTFIALMGGELSVTSQPGQGTTFAFPIQVDYPAKALPNTCKKPQKRHVIGLTPGQSIPKILVVEDQPDTQELIVRLLSSIGFDVRAVGDGQAAIELCPQWLPHLVWMDIHLPVVSGLKATQQIKAQYPSTVVIALTAQAFEEEQRQALAAGCDDFVRKPFVEQELWDKIVQYLNVTYLYDDMDQPCRSELPLPVRDH